MESKVTPIDGTRSTGRAPTPKFGLILAVYKTVDAYGLASEAEVYDLLPAAIEKSSQVVTRKRVHSSLYQGVYQGYLCSDKGKFKIAPLEYYNARQRIISALDGKTRRKKLKQASRIRVAVSEEFILHPFMAYGFISAVFIGGVGVGYFVGYLVNSF